MSLQQLPNELLCQIAWETVPDGIVTFAALDRRCRRASTDAWEDYVNTVRRFRYVAIAANVEDTIPPLPPFEACGSVYPRPISLLETIKLDPSIAKHIRFMSCAFSNRENGEPIALEDFHDHSSLPTYFKRFYSQEFIHGVEPDRWDHPATLRWGIRQGHYDACLVLLLSLLPNLTHIQCSGVSRYTIYINYFLDLVRSDKLNPRLPSAFQNLRCFSILGNSGISESDSDDSDISNIIYRASQLRSMKCIKAEYRTVPRWPPRRVQMPTKGSKRPRFIESVELIADNWRLPRVLDFLMPFVALRIFRFWGTLYRDPPWFNREEESPKRANTEFLNHLAEIVGPTLEELSIMTGSYRGDWIGVAFLTTFPRLKRLEIDSLCLLDRLLYADQYQIHGRRYNERWKALDMADHVLTRILPPSLEYLGVCFRESSYTSDKTVTFLDLLTGFEEERSRKLPNLRRFVYGPGETQIDSAKIELWVKIVAKISAGGVECVRGDEEGEGEFRDGVWYKNWLWSFDRCEYSYIFE